MKGGHGVPALGRQRQLISEFKDSQVYSTSSEQLHRAHSSGLHRKILSLKTKTKAGEMAQRLRALTALLKVWSANPSNHVVAHNHL